MAEGSAARAALPLTQAQLGVLQGQRMTGDDSVFHAAEVMELLGPLDVSAFEQALQATLREARALHLQIAERDGRWQQQPFEPVPARFTLRGREGCSEEALQAEWREELQRPFDLERGHLHDHILYRLGPERHCWFHRAHHLLLDGYGFHLVSRRVAAHYEARRKGVAVAASPFTDLAPVVEADQHYRASPQRAADREFWLRTLHGLQPKSLAPLTHEGIGRGRRLRGSLPPHAANRLRAHGESLGFGLSELLIAAFAGYLHRYGHGQDVVLGMPVMQRLGTPALRTPCTTMNVMPLPLVVAPEQNLADLAAAVRRRIAELRPHQRYRFEHLEGDLEHAGHARGLLATEINVMPFEHPASLGDCRARTQILAAGPVEDLAAIFTVRGGGIGFDLDGRPENYTPEALAVQQQGIAAWIEHWALRPQLPLGELG